MFGVSDIERYYSGKMLPTEMHELEKAALDDPFLADALDGYAHTKSASEDVADLKARINTRKQQGKPNVSFLRAAAMVLILAGAGWLLYEATFKNQDDRISYRNQSEMTSQPIKDSIEKEATLPEEKAVVQESTNKQENKETIPDKNNRLQTITREDQLRVKDADLQSSDNIVDSPEGAEERASIVSAAPAAVPQFKSMRKEIKESFDSNETAQLDVVQNKIAPKDKIEITNNGSQVIIHIKESEDGIHEMVLSKQKKDSTLKKSPSIIVEEAEPEESWNEYGAYLSDHMRSLEDLQSEPLNGTLKLSFDVNPSGEPINIQIENSLCKNCDAEALRLLKEGPKWKKKTKRGKVTIQY